MTNGAKKVILAVDDSVVILRMVQDLLKDEYQIAGAVTAAKALDFLERNTPDLILLDVEMPEISGYDLINTLKGDPRWEDIPVIFLTSMSDPHNEERGLAMGAVDYISKPITPGILIRRVQCHIELQNHRLHLEKLVHQKTEQLVKTNDAIMEILASVTSFRDNETGSHIRRTTRYVEAIVEELSKCSDPKYCLEPSYRHNIVLAAKLHDIGKVAIPDSILLKPALLTQTEFEHIKLHTTIGSSMIRRAMEELGDNSGFLATAHEIIETHHERWDGSGYPKGRVGEEIPISGRIMAIADVYDALISHRPYKEALSHEMVMTIINSNAGNHFDPDLMSLCREAFAQFKIVVEEIHDDFFEKRWRAPSINA